MSEDEVKRHGSRHISSRVANISGLDAKWKIIDMEMRRLLGDGWDSLYSAEYYPIIEDVIDKSFELGGRMARHITDYFHEKAGDDLHKFEDEVFDACLCYIAVNLLEQANIKTDKKPEK